MLSEGVFFVEAALAGSPLTLDAAPALSPDAPNLAVALSDAGYVAIWDPIAAQGDGAWQELSETTTASNQQLLWRVDVQSATADLYLNGRMVAADVPFAGDTPFADRVTLLELENQSLDAIRISQHNSLFVDTSRDGLPDAWLQVYLLDPTSDQRDAPWPDAPDTTVLAHFLSIQSDPLLYHAGIAREAVDSLGVLWEYWADMATFGQLSKMLEDPRIPAAPTEQLIRSRLSGPVNYADKYFSRMRAWLTPEVTGDYTLWLTGDNESQLWLSDTASPAQRALVAAVPAGQWAGVGEWDKFPTQRSASLHLEAGKRYYIEAIMMEGGGEDLLDVAWNGPGKSLEIVSQPELQAWMPDGWDLDADGLPDHWEMLHGLDPADNGSLDKINGPLGDADGDGLLNELELYLESDPLDANTDGDALDDLTEFLLGGEVLVADQTEPIAPLQGWTLSDFAEDGLSNWLVPNEGEVLLTGRFGVTQAKNDDSTFASQTVTGNFDLIGRVALTAWHSNQVEAGFMARETLAPDSKAIYFRINSARQYLLASRASDRDRWKRLRHEEMGAQEELWLRLRRVGNLFISYRSADGRNWQELARTDFPASAAMEVGMFASGPGTDYASAARFFDVALLPDADGDGLADALEQDLGTDSSLADTDGDGFTDYEEVREFLSNPVAADLGAPESLGTVDPASLEALHGDWTASADGVEMQSFRGVVRLPFEVSEAGIHLLEIDQLPAGIFLLRRSYDSEISVDGQFVARWSFEPSDKEEVGTQRIVLPWLQAGTHHLDLLVDNYAVSRRLTFPRIEFYRVGGPDADANGRPDWVDARLQTLNAVEIAPVASAISPVWLEGRSRYGDLANSANAAWFLAPGDRWAVSLDLQEEGPTSWTIELENGAVSAEGEVTWTPTDLAAGGSLTLQAGQSLLVTDSRAGQTTSTLEGRLVSDGSIFLPSHALVAPEKVTFETAGVYALQATVGSQTSTLQVEVEEPPQFAAPPVSLRGQLRSWNNPALGESTLVEVDERMLFTEVSTPDPDERRFVIANDGLQPRHLLGRKDADSSPAAFGRSESIAVASGGSTRFAKVKTYEDGARIIEMDVVQSQVRDDVTMTVDIFVAGVTLDDGRIFRTLTSADFDELGVCTLRFHLPGTVKTSSCHQILIYHEGVQIGGPE